jgi:hypothetical protein
VTGKAWTLQTLTSILTSPRIAGFRTHRGKVFGEGHSKRIIDEARHDALVAALAPRPSKPRRVGRVRSSASLSAQVRRAAAD